MNHPLATIAALLAIALAVAVMRWNHHRKAFGVTMRRRHPELVELGRVAGRAVDVGTPAAPRQLADLEVV